MHAHSSCVIQCTLFNKSKRKAYINAVSVYNRQGTRLDATWSDAIDELGNPQSPCQLIGLVDSCPIFIRMNNGEEIDYAQIEISHSFPDTPMNVIFDPIADWGRECYFLSLFAIGIELTSHSRSLRSSLVPCILLRRSDLFDISVIHLLKCLGN